MKELKLQELRESQESKEPKESKEYLLNEEKLSDIYKLNDPINLFKITIDTFKTNIERGMG